MKRAPVVLSGTALGVAGLIGFHTTGSSSALSAGQSPSTQGAVTATTSASGSSNSRTAAASTGTTTSASSSGSSARSGASAAAAGGTRTAVGQDVQYQFGDLQLKVTMTGSKLTDIQVLTANVVDPRSASIDQYALPQLRAEALSAQSARINGVSGASYTSAAYAQSLQSALDKLKA